MIDRYQLGKDILGPVFAKFCYRLWQVEVYKKDVPVLFISRGGLRLRSFYDAFIKVSGLKSNNPKEDLYLSRVAVFRALFFINPDLAIHLIAKEYNGLTVMEGSQCFLPDEIFMAWKAQLNTDELQFYQTHPFSEQSLRQLVQEKSAASDVWKYHIKQQYDLLLRYFEEISSDSQELILVDTGWSGSIIQALKEILPDKSINAMFFGRYNYGKDDNAWFDSIVGLITENKQYNPFFPVTAIYEYRHLIEGVCEPQWPSVDYLTLESNQVSPQQGSIPDNLRLPGQNEGLARGVIDYLSSDQNHYSPLEIERAFNAATTKLRKLIFFPNRQEAALLSVGNRSADFGKNVYVDVLLENKGWRNRLSELRSCLWIQGQAAQYDVLTRFFIQIAAWSLLHIFFLKKALYLVLYMIKRKMKALCLCLTSKLTG